MLNNTVLASFFSKSKSMIFVSILQVEHFDVKWSPPLPVRSFLDLGDT